MRVSLGAPATALCPVCARPAGEPFAVLTAVPVHPNVLWPTAAEAAAAPRGDVSLALCSGCGLIWNTSFDPTVLSYDADYENSLHFSEAFRRYSDDLVERLLATHELRGKHVAELGSGKGEFLTQLCARAACTGVGFDPSYDGESDAAAGGRVRFVRELFGPDSDLGSADLVITRHVVEHLESPVEVLATVRRALAGRTATLYVEVPAAEYLLEQEAVWDVIYPHVSCFSAQAMRGALERAGFTARGHGYSFGGQYLWVEASTVAAPAGIPAEPAAATLRPVAAQFADGLAARRNAWADRLPRLLAEGKVALWGAGAKGATFLNVVAGGEAIEAVVDVNPRKQGKYVPGTGQLIVDPGSLVGSDVRAVIVMNPVYVPEIEQALHGLGIEAEVAVA